MEAVVGVIREKIGRLLQVGDKVLPVDQALTKYGLDSIKTIMLVVQLEEAFGIVFEDNELRFENFATVQLVADLVKAKLADSYDQTRKADIPR